MNLPNICKKVVGWHQINISLAKCFPEIHWSKRYCHNDQEPNVYCWLEVVHPYVAGG